MNGRRVVSRMGVAIFIGVAATAVPAQTYRDSGAGPLRPERPQQLSQQDIIRKFAENESGFKLARKNYSFTQDVTIQTLRDITPNGKPVADGEFKQVTDVWFDKLGKRVERVTFAPPSSLRRITLSPQDLDDIRDFMPFAITTEDLPHYDVKYAGQQQIDELESYVFDVSPKSMERDKRYFEGRIWVETRDLAIVKTCGKSVPDIKKKKGEEDVQPKFVTYREQVEGHWFPTYTRSDDFLFF